MASTATKASDTETDRAARMMRMFRADPVRWAELKLGFVPYRYRRQAELEDFLAEQDPLRHMWARTKLADGALCLNETRSYQAEGLMMLAEPGRYIWRWPNGVGKTTGEAIAVLWFLDNFPDSIVVTTAGTWSQIRDQLWREIPYWANRSRMEVVWDPRKILKTGIDISDKWFAIGRAANREATFEGLHSRYVLVIFDEAKAVPADIYDAARRILRGDGKMWWLLGSSPSSPSGPFYDACQSNRWTQHYISGYEAAVLKLQDIDDDLEELGANGPLFWSMVLAEFPIEGEDTILSLADLQSCVMGGSRGQEAIDYWKARNPEPMVGIDVARFGPDETVVCRSLGAWLQKLEAWRGHKITETCGRARQLILQWGIQPGNIQLDDDGVGGGLTDMLEEMNFDPTPIHNNATADDPKHYANWICEAWFKIQRAINNNAVCIPKGDKILLNQLASRRHRYTQDGRFKLESKAEIKADQRPSPDRAEGYIYSAIRKTKKRRQIPGKVYS